MCYYKNVLYRGLSVVGKLNLFTKIMNKFIKPVETEEDYLIDSNDEIKPLIIAFGGISGGIYQPVFEFKNFLQKTVDCHFIFVKDTNQCWYHKGAIGLGNDIETVSHNLKNIINTINYSKVVTIGGSMGGFAALLFGSLLNVDGIISFSPQTFIDKESRKLHGDDRWSKQLKYVHKNFNRIFFDLSNLKFNNIKVYSIYGKEDRLDKIHSEKLRSKGINISSYSGGHNVVKTIRDNGELIKIINDCIF